MLDIDGLDGLDEYNNVGALLGNRRGLMETICSARFEKYEPG